MSRTYRSIEEARRAFDDYARIEPRLTALWNLCRDAAPSMPDLDAINTGDETYGADPFETDLAANEPADDGWCSEDYFLGHVKSKLLLLVGVHRMADPDPLHSSDAYETIYDILVNWALTRSCSCCADAAVEDAHHADDGERVRYG